MFPHFLVVVVVVVVVVVELQQLGAKKTDLRFEHEGELAVGLITARKRLNFISQ